MKTYTVVGVWLDDRPIPVGVIRGDHEVFGGDEKEFPAGLWGTSVEADSDADVEARAIEKMLAIDAS